MTVETTKLDELFRCLPKNSGIDPRLIEDSKTELNVLKFRAGSNPKTKTWTKSDTDKLQEQLREKETEVLLLKRQLQYRQKPGVTGGLDSPAEIQTRYRMLYDTEWSVVYDYFKTCGWNDIEIIITLQRILRASFAFCKDVSTEQLQNIEGEALYPSASWMDDNGIITRLNHTDISREIRQLAKLYQRTTATECLAALQKAFTAQVLPTFVDPSKFDITTVEKYARHCVQISWAMCVQDPPMAFVNRIDRGAPFDTDRFRKYTESGGDKFDYLVWPAMLLHKGGHLLVKGVAQTIGQPRIESPRSKSRDSRFSRGSQHSLKDEPTPRTSGTVTPRSQPRNAYIQAPAENDNLNPSTPYFEPGRGTPRSTNSVQYRAGPIDETETVRSSRHTRSEAGQRDDNDLTVVWRKQHVKSAY